MPVPTTKSQWSWNPNWKTLWGQPINSHTKLQRTVQQSKETLEAIKAAWHIQAGSESRLHIISQQNHKYRTIFPWSPKSYTDPRTHVPIKGGKTWMDAAIKPCNSRIKTRPSLDEIHQLKPRQNEHYRYQSRMETIGYGEKNQQTIGGLRRIGGTGGK